ncbi:hypothetical protein BH11PSE5_BH11PSE5_10480 [soil metagenome]
MTTHDDPKKTETDPKEKDDAPIHDPEQDEENIKEEGEPFPGNFA